MSFLCLNQETSYVKCNNVIISAKVVRKCSIFINLRGTLHVF